MHLKEKKNKFVRKCEVPKIKIEETIIRKKARTVIRIDGREICDVDEDSDWVYLRGSMSSGAIIQHYDSYNIIGKGETGYFKISGEWLIRTYELDGIISEATGSGIIRYPDKRKCYINSIIYIFDELGAKFGLESVTTQSGFELSRSGKSYLQTQEKNKKNYSITLQLNPQENRTKYIDLKWLYNKLKTRFVVYHENENPDNLIQIAWSDTDNYTEPFVQFPMRVFCSQETWNENVKLLTDNLYKILPKVLILIVTQFYCGMVIPPMYLNS